MATPNRTGRNWCATIPITRCRACDHPKPAEVSSVDPMMKQPLVFLMLSVCAFCGCSKRVASSAANSPQSAPEQAAQIEADYVLPSQEHTATAANPATPQPQPAQRTPSAQQPIQQRLNGAIHARLTILLRQFVEKTGRMPE